MKTKPGKEYFLGMSRFKSNHYEPLELSNIRQEGNMICAVTLNPALYRTVWVKKIQPDDSKRIEREQRYAGGKGIDQSKALISFGSSNKMFGIKIMRLKRRMEDFDLILRFCRLRDLPRLRCLFKAEIFLQASAIETRPFNSLLSFRKWMKTNFQVFYVIEVKKDDRRRIIGFIGLYNIRIGQSVFLSLAIFNPGDRGRGYGRQSLEMLMDSFQKNGAVKTVAVEILKNNAPSLCFFRKAGFEVRKKQCEEAKR